MTTLRPDFDLLSVFEMVKDANALEVVQRVLHAEAVFHEARLVQLKELDKALGARLQGLRKTT